MNEYADRSPRTEAQRREDAPDAPLARVVGQTRFVVLLAVAAVLLVAMALFVLGAVMAVATVWSASQTVLRGDLGSTSLTVQFLEIVSVMLKAVIFYIIGVGFYSLFITPLNLPLALGVETLHDLEAKVVSAIVVIMSVTFLERFILWEQPSELVPMGIMLAVVVLALVAFQFFTHWAKEQQIHTSAETRDTARHRLFRRGESRQDMRDGRSSNHRAGRVR
jgi:uncharacterized membrane protein YqhA